MHYEPLDAVIEIDENYNLPRGYFLAGGAALSMVIHTKPNDYDVFFKNKTVMEAWIKWAYTHSTILSVSDRSIYCVHNGYHVNLITMRTYEKADDLFEDFDFTVCMFAWDRSANVLRYGKTAYADLEQRKLVFNTKTRFPFNSLTRVLKYAKKGFSISNSEMYKVAIAAYLVEIASDDDVIAQLGGFYGERVKGKIDWLNPWVSLLDNLGKSIDVDSRKPITKEEGKQLLKAKYHEIVFE